MIKEFSVPKNFSYVIDRGVFLVSRNAENYVFMASKNISNKKYFSGELNKYLKDKLLSAIAEQKILNYGTTIHLLDNEGIKSTPVSTEFKYENTQMLCDFKNIIYEKEINEDFVSDIEILENTKEADYMAFSLFCDLYYDIENITSTYVYKYLQKQLEKSSAQLSEAQKDILDEYIPNKYRKDNNYWYIDYIDNKIRIYTK